MQRLNMLFIQLEFLLRKQYMDTYLGREPKIEFLKINKGLIIKKIGYLTL